MHRFVETRTIGRAPDCDLAVNDAGVADVHARLALRADGEIWLLGSDGEHCLVERGSGWVSATRLCLCTGDRIRLADRELTLVELCGLLGLDPADLTPGAAVESAVPGMRAPVPLRVRPGMVEKLRRNPGTGQLEQANKERR